MQRMQTQNFQRNLSIMHQYVEHNFKWKLICLGAFSSGLYIFFGINHCHTAEKKKKVVLLGSGWAAVNFIRNLKPELYELSVVSPANYFLFTPLLPSVTVGTVEIRSVVEPIRNLIHKKHKNTVYFYEGECVDVDIDNQKVICKDNSGKIIQLCHYNHVDIFYVFVLYF